MNEELNLPDTGEMSAHVEALMEVTYELLSLEDLATLRTVLDKERGADLADLIRRLDDDTQEVVFGLLEPELAADVLAEADTPTTAAIVEEMDHETLSGLLGDMEPDDAADVLSDMPEDQVEAVLGLMEEEDAQEVQDLMVHEEDTGGGIMTSRLALADERSTVVEVIETLRREAEEAEIFNLFVVDTERKLQGVVPLHLLVTARPQAVMASLMDRDVISVTAETDQEEIAQLFTRYNLVTLPVVDDEGRVVGQITVDDVMDVIVEEATEDIYKMAGTSDEEIEHPSVFRVAWIRLPWLMLCLLGSFLSGLVIHNFEVTLEKAITLASFIPVIMATGGNSGLQSSTVTVRGLVTGHLSPGLVLRMVLREIGTAVVIGIACGIGASAVALLWFGQALVGACVGMAMFVVVCFAVFIGVLAPLVFTRIGIDPAVASGPFITTTNDVVGIFIYLTLATVLIQRFA